MSDSDYSHDDDKPSPTAAGAPRQIKKRRVQTTRACDRCRLKKIRCDGVPGSICSHCSATDSPCVFTPRAKPARYIDKKYVDKVETRMRRLERLLARLHPGEDFTTELETDQQPTPAHGMPVPDSARSSASLPLAYVDPDPGPSDPSAHLRHLSHSSMEDEGPLLSSGAVSDDEDGSVRWPIELSRTFRDGDSDQPLRYYGRSSSAHFIQTAISLRGEAPDTNRDALQRVISSARMRPEFWKPHPWERALVEPSAHPSPFVFPEADLLVLLIDNYFKYVYPLLSFLHRPTFLEDFKAGKHLYDDGFGAVVLLVCALAARSTNDSRVFLDHPDRPAHPHSAGWAWFRQVQLVRNTALVDPGVCDLQIICLSAQYMAGISPAQACWTIVGVGIRMAMDVGAHRKRMYQEQTITTELWKRAFWTLFAQDVWFSAALGKPCAMSLSSIDVDLPSDCDDEYWLEKDPAKAFKQPPGKPSVISAFVCLVRLYLIYSHVVRTIYSVKAPKDPVEGQHNWWQSVISDLDSELKAWSDSVPAHLRFNPKQVNDTFFVQGCALQSGFYLVQMTTHRPFIALPTRSSPLCLSSLAKCTTAARACIHVQQVHQRRLSCAMNTGSVQATFIAGVVLLLRIWLARRAKMRIDADKEMEDIHHAVCFLSQGEARWPLAGRFKDILVAISNLSDLPLPAMIPNTKHGRTESDDEVTAGECAAFQPSSPQRRDGRFKSFQGPEQGAFPPHPFEPVPSGLSSSEVSTFGPPLSPRSRGLFLFDMNKVKTESVFDVDPLFVPVEPRPGTNYDPIAGDHQHPQTFVEPQPGKLGTDHLGLYHQHFNRLPPPSRSSFETHSSPPPPDTPYSDFQPHPSNSFAPLPAFAPQAPQHVHDEEFLNLLGPMVPQNSGVASDAATVWSAMPVTFRSDEWDNFLSGFMGITSSGLAAPGEDSRQQQQQQQQQQQRQQQQQLGTLNLF